MPSSLKARRAAKRHVKNIVDKTSTVDPTGTGLARARLNTLLRKAAQRIQRDLFSAIVEQDILGTKRTTPFTLLPGEQQARLEQFINATFSSGFQDAGALASAVAGIYAMGWRTAHQELGIRSERIPPPPPFSSQPYTQMLASDLAGILAATRTTIFRSVAKGSMAGASNQAMYSEVAQTMRKIALARFKLAVMNTAVTTFNHAKLDAYGTLGVGAVGVVAEREPEEDDDLETHTAAAEKKETSLIKKLAIGAAIGFAAQRLLASGAGESGEQEGGVLLAGGGREPPPPIPRSPDWRGGGGLPPPIGGGEPPDDEGPIVQIQTAGDDKVCDICEDFEGETYTLQEARGLIPAHINCRCVVIPAPGFIPPQPEDWATL